MCCQSRTPKVLRVGLPDRLATDIATNRGWAVVAYPVRSDPHPGMDCDKLIFPFMPTIDIQSLKSMFQGELLEPADVGYNEARRIWNASVDKRPALIARCTGVADVVAAVNFGRTTNLLTAVRGGGHN